MQHEYTTGNKIIWLCCDQCGVEYTGEAGDDCPQCEAEHAEYDAMNAESYEDY